MRPGMRFLLGLAAVLAVVAFVVVVLTNRPGVPQRDYAAEYAAHQADHHAIDPAAAADWEALRSFDRYRAFERMLHDAIGAAIDQAEADGIDTTDIDRMRLYESLHDEFQIAGSRAVAEHALEERLLEGARSEARRDILTLNRRPEIVAATERFSAHGIIGMGLPETRWLEERVHAVLQGFRPARDIALFEEIVLLNTDDPAEFERSIASTLASARIAASEPLLLSQLTVYALEQMAFRNIFSAIDHPERPLPEPRALLRLIDRHSELRPGLGWFLHGERLLVLDIIDAEFTNRPGFQSQHAFVTIPVVGVSHRQMHRMADAFFDQVEEALGMRFAERGDASARLDRSIQRADLRAKPMLEDLLSAIMISMRFEDQIRAERAGVRTALALAAYRVDHDGVWPSTLEQLVPEYLDALPDDPFAESAGEPLLYRVEADGRIWLYSRGPDLTDNGGTRPSKPWDVQAGEDMVFLPRP